MRYEINKTNYHTFETIEVNKLAPRSYFIPYPDRAGADAVTLKEKRYRSPKVICLNGEWDFKFYPVPEELPDELDTEQVEFDRIDVPSCWQFRGYDRPFYVNTRYQFPYDPPKIPTTDKVGKVFSWVGADHGAKPRWKKPENEYNFVGVYRRRFQIEDPAKNIVLSFLGVASCLDLYVNGQFVGYSEGSHNTAEFDISGLVRAGENELLAVVHRWCTGTYLECQDMFRNNGIFRDVLLRISEPADFWDIDFQTKKSKKGYTATATAMLIGTMAQEEAEKGETASENGAGQSETAPKDGAEQSGTVSKGETERTSDEEVTFTLTGPGVNLTKKAKTKDRKATVTFENLKVQEWTAETPVLYDLYCETKDSCVKLRVGFKSVSIEGNLFKFNDRLIKFHGVNHHDTSCTNGYAMTPDEIEWDIRLCREFNIDTIRTSHYPPDPYLLELCDELGIYVVDEADVETHGAFTQKLPASYNRISNDPKWEKHFTDRAARLYQRDKLHVSVFLWSLGNESGGAYNTDKEAEYLKAHTEIPVHYEGAIHTKRKAYDVGSQMYPPAEEVRTVGDGSCKTPQLLDRPYFLCEYAHAMGVGPGNIEAYWKEIYSYDNLMGGCVWEMVDHAVLHPDGSYTYGGDHGEWEHDGNFCVDGIFYPDRTPSTGAWIVRHAYRPLRISYLEEDKFEVFNTTGFTDGKNYRLECFWSDGGKAEVIPDVKPRQRKIVRIVPKKGEKDESLLLEGNLLLTIHTVDTRSGKRVATEQISLEDRIYPEPLKTKALGIYNNMSLGKGRFTLKLPEGEMTSGSPYHILFRAATDNDTDIQMRNTMEPYYQEEEKILTVRKSDRKRVMETRIRAAKQVFDCTDVYESCAEGILVTSKIHCVKGGGEIPRFGMTYCLDNGFTDVSYQGRSGESYVDMKEQFPIGRVSCKVSDMTEPNIRPQESGNRCDCSSVTLSNGRTKVTFRAVGGPFELGIKPYSDMELTRMKHREDERPTGTYVTIQAFQMGIGTGSCGPAAAKEFRYPANQDYEFKYLISVEEQEPDGEKE